MTESTIDTLRWTHANLGRVFQLLNAWADPDRAFMNDFARYDANMVLAETYARLAQIFEHVKKALENPEHGPEIANYMAVLSGIQYQIKEAEAKLAHITSSTPSTVKAGKREVIL